MNRSPVVVASGGHFVPAEAPLVCSEEEFVCHADCPDPLLNQHFEQYIRDIDVRFDASEVEVSIVNPEYGFVASSDSALLLHRTATSGGWSGASVVGYYNTPGAVCIADEHQGQGLGAELILWTAINVTAGPPTEGLDEQCFSEAGYAAHLAAWRLGVERGLIVDGEYSVN
jgi:GNAT superfamily N-acetyltransferase